MQLPACTRVLPRPSTHRFVLGLFSTDDPIIPKDLAILYPTKLRFLIISYDFCDLAQEKSCFSSCFLSICQRTFHISPLIFTIFMQKEREFFLSLSFQIFSSASAIVITGILISTCVPFSLSRYVTPYFSPKQSFRRKLMFRTP